MTKQNGGPVALREKTLKDGRTSLYLDIYQDGKRTYEFLKLYTVPARTKEERERNRETLRIAQAIQAQRVIEIQEGTYGYKSTGKKMSVLDFFDETLDAQKGEYSEKTIRTWESCRKYLEEYGAGNTRLSAVTSAWVDGVAEHMRRAGLKEGSVWLMMTKVKCALHRAAAKDLIRESVISGVAKIKKETGERMYLTLDELRKLTAAECGNGEVKRAFLFSCLTGLRLSDVTALRWASIVTQDGMARIIFRQQKTGGQEYLDISPEAERYLGERGGAETAVFDLPTAMTLAKYIDRWVAAAGIEKKITFHCARHTFATLMLSLDVDIYTVSKLLGHADIGTTQIYAKVIDKNKQKAVMKIPKIE